MIAVVKIEFDSENRHVNGKSATTIKDANAILSYGRHTAPKDGGYDKTAFKITFADGYIYSGRVDLQHWDVEPDTNSTSLADHIRHHCLVYSGQKKMDRWTDQQYQIILNRLTPEERADKAEFLLNYDLGDG